jgi:leukotriene-A4 hydrolase
MDPNSLSNIDKIKINHISIQLTVDFFKKMLIGFVDLSLEILENNTQEIILDTKNLTIHKIIEPSTGKDLKYSFKEEHPIFGKPLHISLPKIFNKGEIVQNVIRIEYNSNPDSSAIQWLEPSQTAGKKYPYLFTQCQAIHCRTFIPCQDAPSVKATYDAIIKVQSPLTAVMSAISLNNDNIKIDEHGMRIFQFKQDIPMSSYLIALAVGELEYREIGPRTRIWSEKSMVDLGAYEFAETETFLKIGEELLGPYVWQRYDILLLPPSFPYGGMENPCLTFVTPTLLAGDRSNADVIAHEISHSWTGNLVTNKTWEHFWLNEGMTVYTERKIYGKLYGEKMRHFKSMIGWKCLMDSINEFGKENPLTALVPKLEGIDPDDAFSSVPYEKGFCFLFYLENLVGMENFEKFLKSYIYKFKFDCITSELFKEYFLSYFSNFDQKILNSIDWSAWYFTPGLPIIIPKFDETLSNMSKLLAKKWIEGDNQEILTFNIQNWTAGQIVLFLDELLLSVNPLSTELLNKMDSLYHVTINIYFILKITSLVNQKMLKFSFVGID